MERGDSTAGYALQWLRELCSVANVGDTAKKIPRVRDLRRYWVGDWHDTSMSARGSPKWSGFEGRSPQGVARALAEEDPVASYCGLRFWCKHLQMIPAIRMSIYGQQEGRHVRSRID